MLRRTRNAVPASSRSSLRFLAETSVAPRTVAESLPSGERPRGPAAFHRVVPSCFNDVPPTRFHQRRSPSPLDRERKGHLWLGWLASRRLGRRYRFRAFALRWENEAAPTPVSSDRCVQLTILLSKMGARCLGSLRPASHAEPGPPVQAGASLWRARLHDRRFFLPLRLERTSGTSSPRGISQELHSLPGLAPGNTFPKASP